MPKLDAATATCRFTLQHPGNDHAVAARLLYLTMTRMLSWLALLCRRRSTLIAETLTLRHDVTVLRRQLGPALWVPETSRRPVDLVIRGRRCGGMIHR